MGRARTPMGCGWVGLRQDHVITARGCAVCCGPRVVYKRRVQGVSPPFLLALRQMNISTLLRLSLSPPAGSAATMAY